MQAHENIKAARKKKKKSKKKRASIDLGVSGSQVCKWS